MPKLNKKIIYAFIVIIVFVAGITIGNVFCVCPDEAQEQTTTIVDLKEKLDLKVQENLIPLFNQEKRLDASLSGEITVIDSHADTFELKVKNSYRGGDFFSYLNEPNFYIKTIKISGDTSIVKQEMKDLEEYKKERDKYSKDQIGSFPPPYKEIKLSIEDLEIDMKVSVESDTILDPAENEIVNAKKIIAGVN